VEAERDPENAGEPVVREVVVAGRDRERRGENRVAQFPGARACDAVGRQARPAEAAVNGAESRTTRRTG
jgi:hypothetical protein